MSNLEQKMHVAVSCPGYRSVDNGFVSTIGSEKSKSCDNCEHFEQDRCNIDLFDKVLTSLDQM